MDPQFWQACFSWPALPFTVLLALVSLYWLMVIIGAIGMDVFDIHFDHDISLDHDGHLDAAFDAAHPHGTLADLGLIGIRLFNIGDVPLMLWLTAFALPAWLLTMLVDRNLPELTTGDLSLIWLRNVGLGLLSAKLITQPLKGKLKHQEPNPIEHMIGRQGMISSLEATPLHGQMECVDPAGGPLKLHARTTAETLLRGTPVEIVDYLPETHIYIVRGTNSPT